jgi:glycosyltransferase involved in cell wall biosynthesis
MTTIRPYRVLYLDCAPFGGGAQESLLSLLTALHSQGQDMVLVTADSTPGGLRERAESWGIRVVPITARHWRHSPVGLWQWLADGRAVAPLLRRALDDFRPELIHLNGLRAGLLYRVAASGGGRTSPIVLHDRDLRVPFGVRGWLARGLTPHVVAISSTVARGWGKRLPEHRIHIVPNGFSWSEISGVCPAALPFSPLAAGSATTVILPADFVVWKRHWFFLRAFALARQANPSLRAVLRGRVRDEAGSVLLARLRRQAVALGLTAEQVAFVTGPGPALPWMAAADMVCACAGQEPFGRTLVEALALGKPVVATPTAGAPEILRGCPAITVVADNPGAFADGLNAWGALERRREGMAAAKAHAEKFSLSRHVAGIQAVYTQCLE